MRSLVLVLHGDGPLRERLVREVLSIGHTAVPAAAIDPALELARTHAPDVILAGAAFPDLDALSALGGRPQTILVSQEGEPGSATRNGLCMRWPFEQNELRATLEHALAQRTRELACDAANEAGIARATANLQGPSHHADRLRTAVDRLAGTETTVLIASEPGLFPAELARLIHARSARRAGPFRASTCRRPGTLLERELFGARDAPGLFSRTAGGTLFLDDVADLDPRLQLRLLAVLESRTWAPLTDGAEPAEHPLDVRLIARTRVPLEERVAAGRFSADLLYRINVLSLSVPPLRERASDLEAMAEALGRELDLPGDRTATTALPSNAHWPGNLAQLEAFLVTERSGDHGFLSPQPRHDGPSVEDAFLGERSLRAVEEALIRHVLREERGNRSRAARRLGINRTTLYNKLRLYGIETTRA